MTEPMAPLPPPPETPPPETRDSKPIYTSRTFWAGIVAAVLPLIPGADGWVKAHPQEYAALLSVVFIVFRKISKGKVTIK